MPHTPKVPRLDFSDAMPFKIDGVYCKLIQLTRGQFAIVDADDYGWLSKNEWSAQPHHSGTKYYAARSIPKNGKKHTLRMHVALNGAGSDHSNLCSLDNRRKNLRDANKSQNSANCKPRKKRQYKGVYRKSGRGEWYESAITVERKRIHLGNYREARKAAMIYDEAALRFFGEFARLNFPSG
jgi:hypothetical protein